MFRIHNILAPAALALGLASCATLPPPPEGASLKAPLLNPPPTHLTGYLKPGQIDAVALLGPPPAPNSLRGKADRQAFEETRALKDTPRWKQAIVDNDLWGGAALGGFACRIGVAIDKRQTPRLLELLERIELDVRTVGTPAKNFYNRPRPLIGNDQPICIPREDWMKTNASYPSGHAMTGWTWGLILSELAPAKVDGLMAQARTMGESRMICGVHYPSDIEAGRTLASAMVARLHAEPDFSRDLAAARRELAGARRAPSDCG